MIDPSCVSNALSAWAREGLDLVMLETGTFPISLKNLATPLSSYGVFMQGK